MPEEAGCVVPGPWHVVHVQRFVTTANVLGHGHGCPGLVILLLRKTDIERPQLVSQGCLRCNAHQRGIDAATEECAQRHVAFHLWPYSSHQQTCSALLCLSQCHRRVRSNSPLMVGSYCIRDFISIELRLEHLTRL